LIDNTTITRIIEASNHVSTTMQPINPDVFKAYDVRGLYPQEVTEDLFRQLGRAFVAFLGPGRFAVTRDMRLSSPSLSQAFIEGAVAQGGQIVDYGLAGTDMMYFAVAADGLDGGAQITASHNPKQYNGCKLVRKEAFPLSGESGIKEMKEMILGGTLPPPEGTPGPVERGEMLARYVDHVMTFIDEALIKPFNVVLDAGSGVAGFIAPPMFDRLPCKTTRLCFKVDGTFPNHEANPLIEGNRRDITERVVAERADIGIAWDGDADRCFFIDGSGEFIAGDFVTALLAESFLMKHPGQTIIYDVRASYAVKDIVARYHGRALMNRVGHAFIKRRMREENAIFGGEVTGHYYFRDNFYADNGFIPALLILELMSQKGQSLRDLLRPLREKYFISGEINTKLKSIDLAAEKIELLAREYSHGNVYRLDGISAEFDDWHFNVRASNTEPLLRLNLEGLTPEIMETRRDELLGLIRG
jgi:phosphomannomutase